jgi:hypothetical protein
LLIHRLLCAFVVDKVTLEIFCLKKKDLFLKKIKTHHLSIITGCGLGGRGGSFSIITFLGGGSTFCPDIVITFL